MDTALWIIAGLLTVAFLAAGITKAITPREQLKEKGLAYVEDFSDGQIKTIGILEVLGAIALIVPAFIDSVTWLVPAAAVGLAITMAGGVIVHARRKEAFLLALVLGILAAVLAVGRIWVAPF